MSDGSKRNRIKYNHSKTAKQLSHISVNEAVQWTHNNGLIMDNSIVLWQGERVTTLSLGGSKHTLTPPTYFRGSGPRNSQDLHPWNWHGMTLMWSTGR